MTGIPFCLFSCKSDPHLPPKSGVDIRKGEKFPVFSTPEATVDCAKEPEATVDVGVRTDISPNTSARGVGLIVIATGTLEGAGPGAAMEGRGEPNRSVVGVIAEPNRSVVGVIAVATAGAVLTFIISNSALLLLEDDGAAVVGGGVDPMSSRPPDELVWEGTGELLLAVVVDLLLLLLVGLVPTPPNRAAAIFSLSVSSLGAVGVSSTDADVSSILGVSTATG